MNGIPEKQKYESAQDVIIVGGIKTKKCGRCKQIKSVDNFHKNKKNKSGHACYCKECCSQEHKQIYIDNREEILQRNHEWHVENKEYHDAYNEEWRISHPEKARAIRRKAAKKFRSTEEGSKKNKIWNKQWREENIEYVKAENKEWRMNHPEECKRMAKKSEMKRLYGLTIEKYDEMLVAQDNKCYICGKSPKKNGLAVDHCHKTKVVRKLLCHGCNIMLGTIEKGEENLLKLLVYLAEHDDPMAISILSRLKK